jgi:hypothetical protein
MALSVNLRNFERTSKRKLESEQYLDVQATSISIAHYVNSTGLIGRVEDVKQRQLLGYCSEKPQDVLKSLLPHFFVTSYNGIDLYDADGKIHAPMKGVAISYRIISGVYGWRNVIDGKLGELLHLKMADFEEVKRDKPLLDKEKFAMVSTVNKRLNEEENGNKRHIQSLKEIIEILTSIG